MEVNSNEHDLEKLKEFLSIIQSIKSGIIDIETGLGICTNVVYNSMDILYEDVREIFKELRIDQWEHFSGCYEFPIPSTNKKLSNEDLYEATENLWDRRTKYGRLRWDLLDYLINQAEAKLNASQ